MADLILVSNPGSSSNKYALFANESPLFSANLEEVTDSGLNWFINRSDVQRHLSSLENLRAGVIRIVAPGDYFTRHQLITSDFLTRLEQVAHDAPLHIEPALKEIQAFQALAPDLPLVAASDSAFHRTLPPIARFYALDRILSQNLDLERFGYHGLSVESVVSNLSIRKLLPRRAIVAHLGSGTSLTAVFENQSIETTMGFSPLEGIPMTTRVGNIDAEAVLYLMRKTKLTPSQLSEFLATRAGLKGLSGVSGDIRELLKLETEGHPNARLALDLFTYHIRQSIGGMIASLGGLDLLVLTGAISERSVLMRARILAGLTCFGLKLDQQKNNETQERIGLISTSDSIPILVHPTNEMGQMARIANQILGQINSL